MRAITEHMAARTTEPSNVKTIDRTARILETLKELEGARVSEVAEELDLANSTAHRYLSSLKKNEFITQEGDFYYVGLRFLELADCAQNRTEVYKLAKPKVNQLAKETGERAEFIVEEHGYAVFVHRAIGETAVRADSHQGKRIPMHATSAGKVILAHLPEHEVEKIIETRGLPRLTSETISSKEELHEELEEIRENGVGFADSEYIDGLSTVSVPVKGPSGAIQGALGVSGPSGRMSGNNFRREIQNLLIGAANELEINIAYQ